MLMPPNKAFIFCGVVFFAMTFSLAFAQKPYRPKSEDQVLEILPKSLSLNRDRMESIRQKLAADPENVDLATAAAQGYIKMGSAESDPRFYGYARSAIEEWWEQELPPASVLKVRAKLKEKDHQYKEAIEDLETLLKRDPDDVQGWVEIVNLYRVIGSHALAEVSSRRLLNLGDKEAVLVATTPLLAVSGGAENAYDSLTAFIESTKEGQSQLVPWAIAMQGDISAILGRFEIADKHYRKALSLNGGNIHLKRTYADFLLDQQHPQPVLKLLADHESDNGCLLLMAIAANRLAMQEQAVDLKSKMEMRFREIRLRGNKPHGRFESRFELELNNDPEKALEIALQNWDVQKENRDARAVLESALAAKNFTAAAPTIRFVKDSRNEDVALAQLVRALEQQ